MSRSTSLLQAEIKKRKPFESAAEEAYLNLLRTTTVLFADFEQLFREYGVTEPQYNVLRILRGAGQPLPSLEVASRMITRVPDITRLVDRLETAGLVARRRCTEDRRVVYVEITAKARDVLAKLDAPVTDLQERQLRHMTKDELKQLTHLLEKARSQRETQPASSSGR